MNPIAAELDWGAHHLRATMFRDDVTDTIVRPTDSNVTPAVTRVDNIDRVRTDGFELAWDLRELGLQGLNVSCSAPFADGRIEANAANPATVGERWLRIPPQRYVLRAAWRFGGRGPAPAPTSTTIRTSTAAPRASTSSTCARPGASRRSGSGVSERTTSPTAPPGRCIRCRSAWCTPGCAGRRSEAVMQERTDASRRRWLHGAGAGFALRERGASRADTDHPRLVHDSRRIIAPWCTADEGVRVVKLSG
jgi:hypothetical protein